MKFSSLHHHPSFTFTNVFLVSALLRVLLILYSEWHDAHSLVKYTDIDYRVFSDAAYFLLHPSEINRAQGPFNSPYSRETYRYTPLLAFLLTPNTWLHPSFGKYLFATCDLVNGWLIYGMLVSDILPYTMQTKLANTTRSFDALHLLNPLVFTISTRGSSESVLSLFVLLTLYGALNGWWGISALMLGLSTHWKIYPVVYGVACLGVLGAGGDNEKRGYLRTLINTRAMSFAAISAGTFGVLGAGCYLLWGYPFLYESYLYHLYRLDHRHNFSPYFYLTYLTYPSPSPPSTINVLSSWGRIVRSPLVSFAPQMGLTLGSGLLFGRRKQDLVFTWFVQTVVFVLFNKVCTSQYFLWYLLFLPLLLPRLSTTPTRGLAYVSVWVGTQALWLSEAYKLEFLGRNVFFGLWVRGCVYLLGNAWVLAGIMGDYVV
ncbi:hypothetical protein L208DRAFT_1451091 [Tricholoma matsutake]|nr:hypothetical protein L208DRAFT_1451091 [Tricholoma matsutake 945]